MPSIWVSDKDYKVLMRVKTALEKSRGKPVGFPEVISYLVEITSISAINEKDEELIRTLEKLRSIAKKRVGEVR